MTSLDFFAPGPFDLGDSSFAQHPQDYPLQLPPQPQPPLHMPLMQPAFVDHQPPLLLPHSPADDLNDSSSEFSAGAYDSSGDREYSAAEGAADDALMAPVPISLAAQQQAATVQVQVPVPLSVEIAAAAAAAAAAGGAPRGRKRARSSTPAAPAAGKKSTGAEPPRKRARKELPVVAMPAPAPAPKPVSSTKAARRAKAKKDIIMDTEDSPEETAVARARAEGIVDPATVARLIEQEHEKKRKLKRKADLARASRHRKKEKLSVLELEVERLNGEIAKMRAAKHAEAMAAAAAAAAAAAPAPAPVVVVKSEPAAPAAPCAACTVRRGEELKTTDLAIQQIVAFHAQGDRAFAGSPSMDGSGSGSGSGSAPSSPVTPQSPGSPRSPGSVGSAASSSSSSSSSAAGEHASALGRLVDKFADSLQQSKATTELHVTVLERLLDQCMPERFLEWVMTQSDKFYIDPCGLWNTLARKELRLDTAQLQSLMALRSEVLKQREREAELRMAILGITPAAAAAAAEGASASAGAGAGAGASAGFGAGAGGVLPLSASVALASSMPLQQSFGAFAQLARLHLAHSQRNISCLRSVLSVEQFARYVEWVMRFGHVCVSINV